MLRPDFLFQCANQLAFIGWALLVVAPRWRFTRAVVRSGALPLMLALCYTLLIGYQTVAHPAKEAGFGSLPEVAALFREPWALLAGWVHYLCFDLAIGIWETRDAERRNLPRWALAPCQIATFLVGPVGLLLYAGMRRYFTSKAKSTTTM